LAGCGRDAGLPSTATPTLSPVAPTETTPATLSSKQNLPTYQAKQTQWAGETATALVTPPLPTSTPGPTPTPLPHPDTALNFGSGFIWECFREHNNQIGISQYPYVSLDILLADDKTDYLYPVWSPDGNWIAYIKSQPQRVGVGIPPIPDVTGTVSIWIMRPDGSDKRQVSKLVSREDTFWADGCAIRTWINHPPVWSPDGKYIVFVHNNFGERISSYYLIDVASGETDRILVQEKDAQPVWLSNDELIIQGFSVQVVQVHSIGDYSITYIHYPVEFPTEALFGYPKDDYYTIQVKDRKLIGSLYAYSTRSAAYLSLWELDIDTQTWTNLKDLTAEEWGNPLVGEQIAFSYGLDDNLYFLDPDTWQVRATYSMPESHIVPELFTFFFPDVISYKVAVNIEANIYGDQIRSLFLRDGKVQSETLVDFSEMDKGDAPVSLLYYSWRP
jgi:hypothetical protein